MSLERAEHVGLALGAWGAVQATAAGVAIAAGGAIRDGVSGLATQGLLGAALVSPVTGYSFVYHLEIYLLFATLVAIGPLVRSASPRRPPGRVTVRPGRVSRLGSSLARRTPWEPAPSPNTSTSRSSCCTCSGSSSPG